MHIYRLAQYVGPGIRTMPYIGPRESIPAGWSIVKRRPVRRPFSSTPAVSSPPSPDVGDVAGVGGSIRGDVA